MKTNKHTFDFLIRICLYTLPIVLLLASCKSVSKTSTYEYYSYKDAFNYNFSKIDNALISGLSYSSGDYFEFATFLDNNSIETASNGSIHAYLFYLDAYNDIISSTSSVYTFVWCYHPSGAKCIIPYEFDCLSTHFTCDYTLQQLVNNIYFDDYELIFNFNPSNHFITSSIDNNYLSEVDLSLSGIYNSTSSCSYDFSGSSLASFTAISSIDSEDFNVPEYDFFITSSIVNIQDETLIGSIDYFNFNEEFNNVIGDCCSIPYLNDLYDWFDANLLNNNTPLVLRNVWSLVFYWIYCEFIILIKNCLVFLFFVANKFIERGVNIGNE